MNWTLVMFLFIGGANSSAAPNVMALTNVAGFRTEELCVEAGQKITEILSVDRRSGQYRHVCVRQQ